MSVLWWILMGLLLGWGAINLTIIVLFGVACARGRKECYREGVGD